MKVKIFRHHTADLLLEGDDVVVDLGNAAVLLVNRYTYIDGYKGIPLWLFLGVRYLNCRYMEELNAV